MTLFLASVRDAAEAEMAIGAGADIIDLKDPGQGALGALAPDTIAACVRRIAARAPVSATIGDLPLEGEPVRNAVLATAASGVDYVKLGLFPGGDAERSLNLLTTEAAHIRLIVVLFADALPDFDAIGLAARIGAHGVMFDTMGKDAGSLPDRMSFMALAEHIATAKAELEKYNKINQYYNQYFDYAQHDARACHGVRNREPAEVSQGELVSVVASQDVDGLRVIP